MAIPVPDSNDPGRLLPLRPAAGATPAAPDVACGSAAGETVADLSALEAVFRLTPVALALLDRDGRIVRANEACVALLAGHTGGPVGDLLIDLTVDLTARDRCSGALEAMRDGGRIVRGLRLPLRERRPGGPSSVRVDLARLADASGAGPRFAVIVPVQDEDPSRDGNALDARIEHLAFHDALTGLPNRALLLDRLEQAMAAARRSGDEIGVMFIDLDRFKTINDTLGHLAGDELLKELAVRLHEVFRASDTIARLGGDEFVVVLPGTGKPEDVALVCAKLSAALARPFDLGGTELHVTASMGISVFPRDGTDGHALLRCADTALYKAKGGGRNTFQLYSAEMHVQAQDRLRTENDLRRALARRQFTLRYQPQVDDALGDMVAIEALVRWQHPDRGMVPPASFIPVAEDTGLIVPIGAWVLQQACVDAMTLNRARRVPLRVAVNVSGVQLIQPDFLETVTAALGASGLAPSLLELEITESALMADPRRAIRTVEALHAVGIGVAIDDFGTGHSSLAYLKRFPVQRLKIDALFVRDVPDDPDDVGIVQAIIALAHQLQIAVIAEGVETAAQRRFLKEAGCPAMQGFLFARPMAIDRLAGWQPPGAPARD